MDGTIVDNITYHHEAWLTFLRKHDVHIAPESFAAQNHGTADEMMIRFFGSGLTAAELKSYGREKEQIYRDLYQHAICEIAGFTRLLQLARQQGLKIALATMGNIDNVHFVLNRLNVLSYFDVIVNGDQVTQGKPHPEVYLTALQKLELPPVGVIAFEDSLGGVRSAQAAGLGVVGVGTAHTRHEFAEWGVNQFISSFDEYVEEYF